MTNIERWREYNRDIFSPAIWIDLGWLYCVSSALQRRVWYGNLRHHPLFPNLYIVLVGPPALGKGLVLDAVNLILRHHLFKPQNLEEEFTQYLKSANNGNAPLLIPMGPNDCTYEALTREMSTGIRSIPYMDSGKEKVYAHSSMSFVLPEFKSLFKRNEDKLPTFTLQTYDCLPMYSYKTKHDKPDFIHNCCLNILSACTPDFIPDASKFKIFNDGFVSRTIFSFERKARIQRFHLMPPGEDQIEMFDHLLEWIRTLTTIFGEMKYSPEVFTFLEDWYQNVHVKKEETAGTRMQTYYGRKRVHLLKLAACIHFSDSVEMEIPLAPFKQALEILDTLEDNMIWGFSLGGRNELAPVTKDILMFIKSRMGPVDRAQILAEFCSEINLKELEGILYELQLTGTIIGRGDKYIYKT